MLELFETLEDLIGIEKDEYEIVDDFYERSSFRVSFLLHLNSDRFLIINEDLSIIGDGKNKLFAKISNYQNYPKFFTELEIDSYQEKLNIVARRL